jgi:hypothetical protein
VCVWIYIYTHIQTHIRGDAHNTNAIAMMNLFDGFGISIHKGRSAMMHGWKVKIKCQVTREKKDNNGRGARTLATTAKAVTRYFSEGMQPPSSSHCSPADAE